MTGFGCFKTRLLVLWQLFESDEAQGIRHQCTTHKIERGIKAQAFLIGRTAMYRVMSDCNPAEVIGMRPKPLNSS